MRAALSRYYCWTHEDTGRLTPRQAAGYYWRIPELEKMFYGEGDGEDDDGWDINAMLEDAEDLGLNPPKG